MRPLFLAFGPDFKKEYSFTRSFESVNVEPLACRLLRIPCPVTNGSFESVAHMLAHEIPAASSAQETSALSSLSLFLFIFSLHHWLQAVLI